MLYPLVGYSTSATDLLSIPLLATAFYPFGPRWPHGADDTPRIGAPLRIQAEVGVV